jgi:hypothetical protein
LALELMVPLYRDSVGAPTDFIGYLLPWRHVRDRCLPKSKQPQCCGIGFHICACQFGALAAFRDGQPHLAMAGGEHTLAVDVWLLRQQPPQIRDIIYLCLMPAGSILGI